MKMVLALIFVLIGSVSCTTVKKNHLGQKLIHLEDFFRNPQVRSYSISPNGEYFAFLKPYKKRMNVFVQKVGKPDSLKRLTSQTDRDIAGFLWKENDTIIMEMFSKMEAFLGKHLL